MTETTTNGVRTLYDKWLAHDVEKVSSDGAGECK